MKVSRKASYGLRALAELARNQHGASARILAQSTGIPEPYLEKILQILKQKGFVVSEKGIHGGYRLGKTTRDISSWDILEALDGGFEVSPRLTIGTHISPCPLLSHCETKSVWEQIENTMRNTLSRITLADLIKNN